MTDSEFWYWANVSRKACELSDRHGWNAHKYAARLAEEALEDGEVEGSKFWKDVELSLTPRGSN